MSIIRDWLDECHVHALYIFGINMCGRDTYHTSCYWCDKRQSPKHYIVIHVEKADCPIRLHCKLWLWKLQIMYIRLFYRNIWINCTAEYSSKSLMLLFFYICHNVCLFVDHLMVHSLAQNYIVSVDWMIVNNEMERIRKEVVMA
jgi:hypothetical protein